MLVRTFGTDGIPWLPSAFGVDERCSGGRWLEKLDRVAGGIVDQYLLAARSADDVVAEAQAGGAQPLHLASDVLDDEMDPVPAPRRGCAAVGHRPPGRTRGAA